jgi:hypothetical protein
LNKDPYFYGFLGTSASVFGTVSSAVHRHRRKAFSKFFSPGAIANLEELVRAKVLKLCDRLEENKGLKRPIIIGNAFRALTTDVISTYSFPQGMNLLGEKDFGEDYNDVNRNFSMISAYNRHFTFIMPLVMAIPQWFLRLVATPGMNQMLDFQAVRTHPYRILLSANRTNHKLTGKPSSSKTHRHIISP